MKRFLKFLILGSTLLFYRAAVAQNCSVNCTTVSATVVDSDGTTWANGSWSITFLPNQTQPYATYFQNGVALNPNNYIQKGSLDGSGNFSVSVWQNTTVTPVGSSYVLQVCPNASAKCGTYSFSTSTTSLNVSSNLTITIPAPRFNAVAGSYGYADVEAILSLPVGATYWNVTNNCQRYYSSGSFACVSGGSGCTITGSQYQLVTVNNIGTGCTPATVSVTPDGTGINVPGALTAQSVNKIVNVTAYSSAGDLGQQFAAAYAANGQKTYQIPTGSYSFSHTLVITPITDGQTQIQCQPGTQLIWTGGSSDIVSIIGAGQSRVGHVMDGCTIVGNSSATAGIHLEAVNGVTISNTQVQSVISGDGILNQGANTVNYDNVILTGNKNNVHNVGVVVSSVNYAANALHFKGGINANAVQWGVYEDAALSATVGLNENNTYESVAFETNGSTSSYGQVFVQDCISCLFAKDYFEYGGNMTNQIVVGDSTYAPITTIIRDNIFVDNGFTLTNTVDAVNGQGLYVAGNTDEGTPTNFVNLGSASTLSYVGPNIAYSGSSYTAGSGTYTEIHKNGQLNFTGSLLSQGGMEGNGLQSYGSLSCSASVHDLGENSGTGYLDSCGTNTSTNGLQKLRSFHSDGTGEIDNLSFDGSGNATFAKSITFGGGAGFISSANGMCGFDSTNDNFQCYNGANLIMGLMSGTFTSGNCLKVIKNTNSLSIQDAGAACGTGGGAVTSWSGDGIFYTNSLSTGAVTATLGTAGAHKWWGNPTGSTTTPGYNLLTTADLPTGIPLANLATQVANTMVANVTSGTATPTAVSIPAGIQFYTAGTGYSAATSANLLGVCTTCVTSAASLTNNALMTGAGSQGSQTVTTGIGVLAALGVNVGSAGAFVTNGGALGTPSSGIGTNIIEIPGGNLTNNSVTATQLAAQYSKGSCTEAWGGSGTSHALSSGDDAVVNNTCYNDSGVTRTITAVKCRSDNASNTTTVNPTFGSAGTGTTILSGALACGNSYAYSSSGTVSNASWTTGTGIDPAMGGTLTGTSIAMIVEYTY